MLGKNIYLVIVVSSGKGFQTIRSQLAAGGVQLLSVVLGELGAEAVDGDDEGSPVRLEPEDLAHNVRGLPANVLAEVVEGLQVRLVQGVSNDLDVHLVQVLLVDAALEEGGEGSVDQDRVVELGRGARDVDRLHLLEAAERVALAHQLGDGSLVQGAGDQQHDVVDHVAVGDVVQEHGEGPGGLVPHVLELGHQLLSQLVFDD